MIFHKCDICGDELAEERINQVCISNLQSKVLNLTIAVKIWELCGNCLERVNDAFRRPAKTAREHTDGTGS